MGTHVEYPFIKMQCLHVGQRGQPKHSQSEKEAGGIYSESSVSARAFLLHCMQLTIVIESFQLRCTRKTMHTSFRIGTTLNHPRHRLCFQHSVAL
jgi:hypothetical protein